MKNGGRRKGAGRPKQKTVLEVALSLSAPAEWEATPPVYRESDHVGPKKYLDSGKIRGIPSRYRASAASAKRSSIPAAAVRLQEIEVTKGRGRRGLAEIEWDLAERYQAQTANLTTRTGFRTEWGEPLQEDDLANPAEDLGVDHVFTPRITSSGSSMSDFLTERFYDGSMQPTELRGLKWVR